jgi:hypothetical protein
MTPNACTICGTVPKYRNWKSTHVFECKCIGLVRCDSIAYEAAVLYWNKHNRLKKPGWDELRRLDVS